MLSHLRDNDYMFAYSYDDTGFIWRSRQGSVNNILDDETDTKWFFSDAVIDSNLYYFDAKTETVIKRPEMPITITGNKITGIPNPSTVYINSTPYEVTDTELEVASDIKEDLNIRIESFPYKEWRGVIKYENNISA